MAVPFKKPKFEYDYDLSQERTNFDGFFTDPDRAIPPKGENEIDLASWNIANLGAQKRRPKDLELIAHILSHFDIIAVQEVNVDLGHFRKVMDILSPQGFDMALTDKAGNEERLAVVYKTNLLRRRQLFGELDYNPNGRIVDGQYVIPPKIQTFTVDGEEIRTEFYNFNRNPFLSTWEVIGSDTTFMLANVHIYYGDDKEEQARYMNRVAEVYFLANWAKKLRKEKGTNNVYEPNIILLGDMNIPKMESSDSVYRALKRRGMKPSKYSTEAGTTLQDFMTYDQIVFTSDDLNIKKIKNQSAVVVDFDNFIFRDLWSQVESKKRKLSQFKAWTKFAVSDHRPLFVRLSV